MLKGYPSFLNQVEVPVLLFVEIGVIWFTPIILVMGEKAVELVLYALTILFVAQQA